MDNYSSTNNYNYDNNSGDMPGFGYDTFNPGANSYDGGNSSYYSNSDYTYSAPTGMEGFKTIATQKVITKSFVFMFVALLITAFAAMTTSPSVALRMFKSGTIYIVFIAEIAIVLISNAAIKKNNAILAGVLYTIYSFLTGITLSLIIYGYEGSSVVATFFVTAGMFAAMAILGLVTKKDLSGIGSLCFMGLIGIILLGVANLFLGNEKIDFGITIIAIVIFVGLTAYDTQKIKQMAAYSTDVTENSLALFGAFQLYLDFINLFLRLLRLMGKRK